MSGAAVLFGIGEGINIGSSLLSGWMADRESKVEKKLAYRNATIAEQNATARLMKAKFDQLRQARAGERLIGRLMTRAGASGVRIDSGAPMRVIVEQSKENELENRLMGYEAEVEAKGLRDQAAMYRYMGKEARRKGKNILRSSLLQSFGMGARAYAQGVQEGFWGNSGGGSSGSVSWAGTNTSFGMGAGDFVYS
jgi:hypothetical protein